MNKYFAFTILTLFSSGACFTKRAKELDRNYYVCMCSWYFTTYYF